MGHMSGTPLRKPGEVKIVVLIHVVSAPPGRHASMTGGQTMIRRKYPSAFSSSHGASPVAAATRARP